MRFLSDKIYLLFLFAVVLSAQPNTVTVTETIYLPDNTRARGTVSLQMNAICSAPPSSSFVYGGRPNPIMLVNGVFTATLVPNANCNPQTSYYVTYNLTNQYGVSQPRANETWYVPASPTTTTIQAVRIGTMPTAPLTLSISQLIGATLGDVFYGNGSGGVSRLAGNITGTKKFLTQVGTGSVSAAPVWNTVIDGAPVTPGCLHTIDGVTIVSTGIACGTGSGGSYSAAMSSSTTWSIAGTTHNLGTCDLVATAYTISGDTRTLIGLGQLACDNTTKDVTITWSVATAGRIVLGTGGGGTGGSSSVTVVNSGTGATILKPDTNIEAKTLVAGNNITITDGTDEITISAASAANPSQSFTNQGSVTIIHNLNTQNILFQCYDTDNNAIGVNSMQVIDENSYTVTFIANQSGRCATNATGGGTGGGEGGDTTVVNNSGSGAQVLKTGTNIDARTLTAGANVTITQNSNDITIAASTSGSESTVVSNSGAGTPILKPTTNVEAKSLVAGSNVTITNDTNTITISAASGSNETLGRGLTRTYGPLEVDPASVPTFNAFSVSYDFPSIPANSYAETTVAVSGAQANDTIAPGWPVDIDPGLIGTMFVSTTGTVKIRLRNVTGSAIDPGARNYNGKIISVF